ASVFNHLTIVAQFAFWGVWWPFVLVSIPLLGRAWCGWLCPEGMLTEWASERGQGRSIPKWMRWGGWPFVAFGLTTVYGQLVSVYQYPLAVLAVLGGSTMAAIVVGWRYGRSKRVWCKYLCPVNGVFNLLAKLAPWHFKVDEQAWRNPVIRIEPVNCAPLVAMRHMKGAGGLPRMRPLQRVSRRDHPDAALAGTRNPACGAGRSLATRPDLFRVDGHRHGGVSLERQPVVRDTQTMGRRVAGRARHSLAPARQRPVVHPYPLPGNERQLFLAGRRLHPGVCAGQHAGDRRRGMGGGLGRRSCRRLWRSWAVSGRAAPGRAAPGRAAPAGAGLYSRRGRRRVSGTVCHHHHAART